MIKLIMLILFLYGCYSLYQHLKTWIESQQKDSVSNKRQGIDPRQVIEAEYREIKDGDGGDENG